MPAMRDKFGRAGPTGGGGVSSAGLAPGASLTKSEIRALSWATNLPAADAPAQPCVSSRIPYGTPVTADALAMIEHAESVVHALRVRHHIEVKNRSGRELRSPPTKCGSAKR
ncbi:MAG: hypothetical protein WCE51_01770 [Chthoniobacterales bacterium]